MISNQIIQTSLDELKAITKVDLCVYEHSGVQAAGTTDNEDVTTELVAGFAASPADSQVIGNNHLMKIYEDMRDAGNTKLHSLINELTPYVKTSFNKSDIIKIGKYALSQGWTKFDIDTQNFPEYRVTGGQYQEYNNLWIWKSDFPADAYYMQTRIYNKSSITLASVRVDTQKVRRSGFFSKGDSATTATIRNEHYGEVTSVPSQNEEEEEE